MTRRPKERLAEKIVRRRHTDVMTENRTRFSDNEHAVALKLLSDARIAEGGAKVTAAYDGLPLGTLGRHHSGIPDAHRESYVRYQHIRNTIDPRFRHVLQWFVDECLTAARQNRTVGDLGTWASGFSDRATAKGAGIVAVKAMLWRVSEIYAERAFGAPQRKSALSSQPTVATPG